MNFRLLLVQLLALLSAAACQEEMPLDFFDNFSGGEKEKSSFVFTYSRISQDFKTIEIGVRRTSSGDSIIIYNEISEVSTVVSNYLHRPLPDEVQPKLVKLLNVGSQEVAMHNINLYAMVDLTLDQDMVDEQKSAVKCMRSTFNSGNFFVRFILSDGTLSERMPVSDYVIENYFVSQAPAENKYIYRNLLEELTLMNERTEEGLKEMMIIMTDGLIYSDSMYPIDPDYYSVKRKLDAQVDSLSADNLIFYVNYPAAGKRKSSSEDDIYLKRICEKTSGLYMSGFSWSDIVNEMVKDLNVDFSDYLLVYENPDGMVFNGSKLFFDITLKDEKGTEIAKTEVEQSFGAYYSPIVVGGESREMVFVRGIVISLSLMILVYLIFQFAVPFVKFQIFKRKYLLKYQGPNMSVEGMPVAQSCYYCKAPFTEGDEIVAKCSHTMHYSCWKENDHHCPEFGRNCPDGGHYYNSDDIYDSRNASFRLEWLVVGIIAGFISWSLLSPNPPVSVMTAASKLLGSAIDEHGSIDGFFASLHLIPRVGYLIPLVLTFLMSLIANRHAVWYRMIVSSLIRTVLSLPGCYIMFLLIGVLTSKSDSIILCFLIEWIPWAVMCITVLFYSSYRTRIQFRQRWLLYSIILGVVLNAMWIVLYGSFTFDYRADTVLCFIVFCVGVSLIMAGNEPRSERYFLHVSGMIKEMDIALYKWFMNSTGSRVTIGKSSDCSIEMSWDIKGDIAPLQAVVFMSGGSYYLTALEPGVFVKGKPLKPDARIRLRHGVSFEIGATKFEYIERDVLVFR